LTARADATIMKSGPSRSSSVHADDAQLIASFLDGDAATAGLVETWVKTATRHYRGSLGEDWHDAVQETLLRMTDLLRSKKFEGRSRLRTYVWRVAHHVCIDRSRARARRRLRPLDELGLSASGSGVLESMVRDERVALGLRVLVELTEDCRRLFQMVGEGMSYGEIGERLGLRPGTLRVRALRCRKRALEIRDRLLAGEVTVAESNIGKRKAARVDQ